jgi:hypothetical protein
MKHSYIIISITCIKAGYSGQTRPRMKLSTQLWYNFRLHDDLRREVIILRLLNQQSQLSAWYWKAI